MMSGNSTNNEKKSRFSLHSDTLRMATLASGVGGIRKTQDLIRNSVDTILHGDQRQAEWTASIPSGDRKPLVRRLRIEGALFTGFIGMILPVSCMLMSAGKNSGVWFWGALSFLSFLTGNTVGLLKFWQSACVDVGVPISFRRFLLHFWSGLPHGG